MASNDNVVRNRPVSDPSTDELIEYMIKCEIKATAQKDLFSGKVIYWGVPHRYTTATIQVFSKFSFLLGHVTCLFNNTAMTTMSSTICWCPLVVDVSVMETLKHHVGSCGRSLTWFPISTQSYHSFNWYHQSWGTK